MNSVIGQTSDYVLQPALIEKHKNTLNWLSETILWKSQLKVYQKLIDEVAPLAVTNDDKKKIDHFQNLIFYYNGEVVDEIRKKLRAHENNLSKMLENKAEWETEYFREHDAIMRDAEATKLRLADIRNELHHWTGSLR